MSPTVLPPAGLTSRHPFQLGYATNDLDRAAAGFDRVYGVREFLIRDPATMTVATKSGPRTMELRLAFAYLGDITVELIEPLSGGISVYTNALPTEGFGVVLHHLGYVVEGTLETWESFSTGIPDESLLFEGAVDDHTRFLYQDTKALTGQHTEYLWWNDDRLAWLDDIPRN